MKERFVIKNLSFFVGSYREVKDEILKQIVLKMSLIILPCSLNDLASISLSPNLKKSYNQIDICTTDGMPLVWWASLRMRHSVNRVYGPDLMRSILVDTQSDDFRHVFCGSSSIHLKSLVDRIIKIAPKINIVGVFAPTIQLKETREERRCLQEIIERKPSVLWLGISSPKQVVLAARWKKQFPHSIIFCVGAAFDLISGEAPAAPEWMQALGLEWLFRLVAEPRRLYKRYLYIIPRFLLHEALTRIRGYFLF